MSANRARSLSFTLLFVIICVGLLLVTSGCIDTALEHSGDRPAKSVVDVKVVSGEGEQVRLIENVTLQDPGHNVTLHDVDLVVVADNGSTMRTIAIGRLKGGETGTYHPVRVNTTVSRPPKELRLRIGRVQNPTNADFHVRAKRRTSEDPSPYEFFRQDEY